MRHQALIRRTVAVDIVLLERKQRLTELVRTLRHGKIQLVQPVLTDIHAVTAVHLNGNALIHTGIGEIHGLCGIVTNFDIIPVSVFIHGPRL